MKTAEEFAEQIEFSVRVLNSDTATRADLIRADRREVALLIWEKLYTISSELDWCDAAEAIRKRIEAGELP